MDPDQTALIGAVCSGSTLFASILNLSVMEGNYLQPTTSADNIFRYIFSLVLRGLRVCKLESGHKILLCPLSYLQTLQDIFIKLHININQD